MMFLLDTNAFSDLMRKHSKLDARMCSLAPVDRVVICPVVRVMCESPCKKEEALSILPIKPKP
jgi:predicted nucleic acid-binding protein